MNLKHIALAWALLPCAAHAGSALLSAPLPDLQGKPHHLGEWNGKIRIVNFWATWCAPCRSEMPLLAATRGQYRQQGVEVIGIAVDQASEVQAYFGPGKADYPILVATEQGQALMKASGNPFAAMPFTVLLDAGGNIVRRHQGVLDARLLKEWLALANNSPRSTSSKGKS